MPFLKSIYPVSWTEQSKIAAYKKANYRCQHCGLISGKKYMEVSPSAFVEADEHMLRSAEITGERVLHIVLTVCHVNHLTLCCVASNLLVLCQGCRLNHNRVQKVLLSKWSQVYKSDFILLNLSCSDYKQFVPLAISFLRAKIKEFETIRHIHDKRNSPDGKNEYDRLVVKRVKSLPLLLVKLRVAILEALERDYNPQKAVEILSRYENDGNKVIGQFDTATHRM